jgi:DNA primase
MSIFQAVKERVRIVDVVGEYTTLKRAGIYFKANCPFHHERTASFTVTPDREIFYCFGCRAGGDVVEFISQIEKCSAREAALHLIERYKLSIPDQDVGDYHGDTLNVQQKHFELCKIIAQWCHEQLKDAEITQSYLTKRSISKESIERFSIGYFPGGEKYRKRLISLIQKSGFLMDDLMNIRLFMSHEQRSFGIYSPFEERIILPIQDHLGRTCGFGGRVFLPEDRRAKYYNSHEHAQFAKSSLLFGFDLAKRTIQKTGKIYVVEGYFDCIAMVQAGIYNTVATLGTACTEEHLKLFGRYVKRVVLMYDGDNAGISATMRLSELCWEYALELHVVTLPMGQDPADFFASNGDFSKLIQQDIFTFYINALRLQFSEEQSLGEKISGLRDILKRIARVVNPLTRDVLLQQVAQVCHVSLATLTREIKYVQETTKPTLAVAKAITAGQIFSPGHKIQKEIDLFAERAFSIIVSADRLLEPHEEELIKPFLTEDLRSLLAKLQNFRIAHTPCHFSDFFATLNSNDQEYIQKLITIHGLCVDGKVSREHMLMDFFERCYKLRWKRLIADFKKNVANAQQSHDYERLQQLLNEFQHIKQTMKK